jgi:hypothetical protein
MRSTELRITQIELYPETLAMLAEDEDQVIRLIARSPRKELLQDCIGDLDVLEAFVRARYGMTSSECLCFLETDRTDASELELCLCVESSRVGRHRVLHASSPAVANSIAALLIKLEQSTGKIPHAYFKWQEGNPVVNIVRFIFLGEGDTASLTHEVLRRAVPDPTRRPVIHVS